MSHKEKTQKKSVCFFGRGAKSPTGTHQNHEKEIKTMALWDEREFDLAERSEELDCELKRDDDGCYWLSHIYQTDTHDIGPFDLDEVEDWITAAENGFGRMQTEEYMADQRWKRLHPEAETE